MRIAIAQINPTVGELKANSKKISRFLKEARDKDADIVVFPELSLTGYPPEDLLLKPQFIKDNLMYLKKITRVVAPKPGAKSPGMVAIIGFVDRDDKGNLYNSAAIIRNRKLVGVYHKMRLPNYGVFDERRYFKAGDRCGIYRFKAGGARWKVGVNICEDIWVDDGPTKFQAKEGANIIINISASPYYAGKLSKRQRLLACRAKESKVTICYANLVGGQDELVFDGGSMIVDKRGGLIAQGAQFREELIVADISARRKVLPPHRLGGARNRALLTRRTLAGARFLKPIEEIYEALVLGTRDYVRKNSFNKVVIGLSGGIDSSLTAVIAVDVLGKDNVVAVSMPSRYSSNETKQDARLIAENLGIEFLTIPIDAILNGYLTNLRAPFRGTNTDITEENLQARIRGNILMALSNKFGWLVLTTGNKSEMATGYCTLYGDMAGGFAVLKDVPKTLVYHLVDYRNSKERLIPESVIKRVPTAELKPSQTDQDTLPPYDMLDRILKAYVEEDKSAGQIYAALRRYYNGSQIRGYIKKAIEMVDRNEYKRRQGPPGIKITPKAFGKDRRMPITNRYR